ncbi:hypothetical protein [Cryobacterium psychrophilum]|uniref:Uncharacterized protein n=1 Tax=Cryobacterium psychrophilum TaxID=41988 RepID=A0A4Y8KKR3_9MICO|nr:hypothetical protein [Cryobacterium psychrophilum]TFD75197.1 hypothetical protein E3T53_16505 [Cryobacterium psychrophilum]
MVPMLSTGDPLSVSHAPASRPVDRKVWVPQARCSSATSRLNNLLVEPDENIIVVGAMLVFVKTTNFVPQGGAMAILVALL